MLIPVLSNEYKIDQRFQTVAYASREQECKWVLCCIHQGKSSSTKKFNINGYSLSVTRYREIIAQIVQGGNNCLRVASGVSLQSAANAPKLPQVKDAGDVCFASHVVL